MFNIILKDILLIPLPPSVVNWVEHPLISYKYILSFKTYEIYLPNGSNFYIYKYTLTHSAFLELLPFNTVVISLFLFSI